MARERSSLADEAEKEYGDLQKAREIVQQNASERRAQRDAGTGGGQVLPGAPGKRPLPAPLIPMPGDEGGVAVAVDSDIALANAEAENRALDEANWKKLDEQYTVFVRCPTQHPKNRPNHAIYLTEYPRQRDIASDKWKSRQRPNPAEPYFQPTVWCQSCLMANIHMEAKVLKTSADGALRLDPRHVYRRPKDPERFQVEGETRVWNVGHQSANQGRVEAMQRSRDAGFEVIDE